MMKSLLIAVLGVISLSLIWLGVQTLWRKVFSEHLIDEDVLAGRTKCSNCGCTTICKEKTEIK